MPPYQFLFKTLGSYWEKHYLYAHKSRLNQGDSHVESKNYSIVAEGCRSSAFVVAIDNQQVTPPLLPLYLGSTFLNEIDTPKDMSKYFVMLFGVSICI